jgi:hypothetical protein
MDLDCCKTQVTRTEDKKFALTVEGKIIGAWPFGRRSREWDGDITVLFKQFS